MSKRKKLDINTLLRENIKNIKPYASARDEFTGVAQVYLDANENPYGSIDGSMNNRYPDPYQTNLKQIISPIKNIPVNQIFLGNGSDEAIELLFKAFCTPGKDKTIISSPTYGMYQVCAETNDIQIIDIKLKEGFELDVDAILDIQTKETKILWVCTPNNPSGNAFFTSSIYKLLDNFNGIVVLDEAYIDFSDEPSWTTNLQYYDNLVVLQTFSKAWGLANIRLGMMFASEEIIKIINKIKMPYNINGLVQDYAINAIKNGEAKKNEYVLNILAERKRLETELIKLACVEKVFKSDANFLLVKTTAPKEIYSYLISKSIVTRERSKLHLCEGGIRITVGTPLENDILLKSLAEYKN
ncbi:MAG: histidinol-phosphate transaminase [Bacteroidales bacterium]|nr:histidinol-phosphate transaminase [Bacteroidales bacterium]